MNQRPGGPDPHGARPARRAFALLAAALYLGAGASIAGEAWRADPTRTVAINAPSDLRDSEDVPREQPLLAADHRFVVWLAARNAWTWLARPADFFDAEPCHPAERSLAYGEPGFTLGALALPFLWASGEPVLAFNGASWLVFWIAPLAMFGVIWRWTGDAWAALISGFLYGFSFAKIGDPVHPYGYDTAWGLLAIHFLRRLIAAGRWRDCAALLAVSALQIGASFYPLLAVTLLVVPIGIDAMLRERLDWRRALRLAVAALAVLGLLWLAFAPYLELQRAGEFAQRMRRPLDWSDLAPGAPDWPGFPGALLIGTALLGLCLPRRGLRGDPRLAIAIALLLALLLGMQRESFGAAARFVPGLAAVRNPVGLALTLHLGGCLLAALGVAALRQRLPERTRTLASVGLLAVLLLEFLAPESFGLRARSRYAPFEIAPSRESLALFDELSARGQHGPLLEVPMPEHNLRRSTTAILRTAWHHQRTSACYNSYVPEASREVARLAARLPAVGAFDRLRALGFETLIVHRDSPGSQGYAEMLERFARSEAGRRRLRRIASSQELVAYAWMDPPRRGINASPRVPRR